MTDAQREALKGLCERYHVEFNEADYYPGWDLPDGYVCGWVGGQEYATFDRWGGHRDSFVNKTTIFVGCDPEGRISS